MPPFELASLGIALAAAAAVTSLGARPMGRRVSLGLAVVVALVVLFAPLPGLSPVGYARGLVSELSVTSMALLGAALVKHGGGPELSRRDRAALFGTVAVSALFLYPMALGLTPFDPYALGYRSEGLVLSVAGVAAAAALLGFRLLPWVLGGGLAAYGLGLGESTNLWDYCLDPWLALYALVFTARRFTNFVRLSKSR